MKSAAWMWLLSMGAHSDISQNTSIDLKSDRQLAFVSQLSKTILEFISSGVSVYYFQSYSWICVILIALDFDHAYLSYK